MLAFDRDAGFLEFEAHLVADILQGVGRRDREVAFLRADLVAEVWEFFPRAVPMSLALSTEMEELIPGVAETHFVEDEKFRFRSEERGVGDAGALQIRLRFFRHAARIAIVRLARDRLDDRANETECRLGVEDVDPRASTGRE